MAGTKISQLTPITTVASADYFPVVQDSDTSNKRVSLSSLLANVPAGSASSPSLAFNGDSNTGIYSPGADQVAISTNGTGRLFVDASGRVGVGTSAAASFDPNGDDFVIGDGAGSRGLTLYSNSTGNGSIYFADSTSGTDKYVGSILYRHADNSLAFTTSAQERLRITSDGKVGLGTSAPQQRLHLSHQTSGGATSLLVSNPDGGAGATAGIKLGVTPEDNSVAKFAILHERFNSYGRGDTYFCSNFAADTTEVTDADAVITIKGSTKAVGVGTTSPQSILHVNASNAGLLITGTTNTSGFQISVREDGQDVQLINNGSGGAMRFYTNPGAGVQERARIDSSGRLLVGTSSSRGNWFNTTNADPLVQLETSTITRLSITRNDNTDNSGEMMLGNSRSSAYAVVSNNDNLGRISFHGADGSEMVAGAYIQGFVDGTPGANDMPGRLVFSTTADGASSPTERMRIRQSGQTSINNSAAFYPDQDNATALGDPSNRWTAVYAINGTIQTSDARQKTDVMISSLGSDFVRSLRPVSYRWLEGGRRDSGQRDEDNNWVLESVPGARTHWGFIAQEVKQAVDAAGVDFGGWVLTDKDDPDSQQALRYDQFIAPLTKALQEALAEIDVLKAKVAALESA